MENSTWVSQGCACERDCGMEPHEQHGEIVEDEDFVTETRSRSVERE